VPPWLLLTSVFVVCSAGGYLLVRTAQTDEQPRTPVAATAKPVAQVVPPEAASRSGDRKDATGVDHEALAKGAIPGQRTITFKDRAAMERFLASLKGTGITVLAQLNELNTLTLGFSNLGDLANLLDGSEESGFIFPVLVPEIPEGSIQPGAVPLGDYLAEWLGIAEYDRSTWGKGVKIAVLDTGISGLASFATKVAQSLFVDLPSDLSTLNGHGTAVAALINSLAPEADLLSYRVADDNGYSNSSLIAQGILQAVADGAHIINISLGGFGDSKVLRDAVAYAQQMGVVVVAAAGNNGVPKITQPASLDGVIAIGAVDARSDILAFSNSGSNLGATAPGYGVTTQDIYGNPTSFTGTSASTPIAVGSLALTMSNNILSKKSNWEAVQLLTQNLNESGPPGLDDIFGGGTLNLQRVLNSNTPGLYDAAVASHWVDYDHSGQPFLQITVENRGTATLFNVPLQVGIGNGNSSFNIGSLSPNSIQTFSVPFTLSGQTTFRSTVTMPGQSDLNSNNNRRTDVYTPPTSK
jgi:hypothetical protein